MVTNRLYVSSLTSQVEREHAALGKILQGLHELELINPTASIDAPTALPKIRAQRRSSAKTLTAETRAERTEEQKAAFSKKLKEAWARPERREKLRLQQEARAKVKAEKLAAKATAKEEKDKSRLAAKAAKVAATTGGAPKETPTVITENPTPMAAPAELPFEQVVIPLTPATEAQQGTTSA